MVRFRFSEIEVQRWREGEDMSGDLIMFWAPSPPEVIFGVAE